MKENNFSVVTATCWNGEQVYYNPNEGDFFGNNCKDVRGWRCSYDDYLQAKIIAEQRDYLFKKIEFYNSI